MQALRTVNAFFPSEYEEEFCKDALQQKNVSLPSNCIQLGTNATTYDVGFCLSKRCRSNGANNTNSCSDKLKSCCVPARLESRTLSCVDYNIEVLVIKECSCGACDAGSIIVNGKAVGAQSGSPVIYGEVWLNGEFVSYTDTSGIFTVTVKNSVDRAIINLKDTYYKEYLDAVRIIDITDSLSGSISIKVPMLKAAVPVVSDSNVETVIKTLTEQNTSANDVAEIRIPADSFYTKMGDKYSGKVSYKMTFINPVETNAEEVPGQFEFINEEGSNTQLASKGVFNIQIEDESGRELIVDDVIDVSFPEYNDQNFTLWKLNEATGIWEPLTLGTESKRRKRRRTEGLIGEIDMNQISSKQWFNLDKPWEFDEMFENICFFKVRVYKDENMSEEITSRAGFKMEYHKVENSILKTYYRFTPASGATCFPASCKNETGYIRFYFSKVTVFDDARDLYAVDIINFPLSYYDIVDGGKTLKVQMKSDTNGPFYSDDAICKASGRNDIHIRFRVETQDDFTFEEATPSPNSGYTPLPLEQLQAIQQKVWYPLVENLHRICFIKINVTFAIDTSNQELDYSNIKFHVVSQGDKISNTTDFVFGVRGFTVNATRTDTTYCVEYKCSGKLQGTDVIDYTRIKIDIRQPSPYHCHVIDIQSDLRDYSFGTNDQQRNLLAGQYWRVPFDGYAPTDYGPSYGIYDVTTDDPTDREAGRDSARQRCMKKCERENSESAFSFLCH